MNPPLTRWQSLSWLSRFTLLNALIAVVIVLSNAPLRDNPGGTLGVTYLALASLGHFPFFAALVSLLPLLLVLLMRQKQRPQVLAVVAVVLHGAFIVLLLLDARLFALYRFHINSLLVQLVLSGALYDQVQLSWLDWALAATVVVVVFTAQAALAWACWRRLPARPRRAVLSHWAIAAVFMVTGQAATVYFDARALRAAVSQWSYLPWALPITAKRMMLSQFGVGLDESTPGEMGAMRPGAKQGVLRYPLQPMQCTKNQAAPNVLMIVLDSLRRDALDATIMPNTWKLAQQSMVFPRHYSSGNSTRPGFFGLLYGVPPSYFDDMLREQHGSVLFQVLQQQGYGLHLYMSAPLDGTEFDRTIFANVRQHLEVAPIKLPIYERDRHIMNALKQDIAQELQTKPRRPWFGLAFLDSSHAPYHFPKGYPPLAQPMAESISYSQLDGKQEALPYINRYHTGVHYADSMVGEILSQLRASGADKNTIVVITGDHGEEFNDLKQGYWGHNGNFADHQVVVPFVLHWPGRGTAVPTGISAHQDFVPTLMHHALGCGNPMGDYSTGRDLFVQHPPEPPVLLVDSWVVRGIRHGDDIYAMDHYGNLNLMDAQNRPKTDAKPDPVVMRSAFEMMTRFRR
ncbi:sulfatase-like hydrolase/transferase [Hylemonella sp. W303a]|uniref:sulfatase-like hydrolase/transferase n=1 Tax=Hylemonella sp. W303a TaxID=3389873 RepID=UPI00396B01BD